MSEMTVSVFVSCVCKNSSLLMCRILARNGFHLLKVTGCKTRELTEQVTGKTHSEPTGQMN